MNKLLFYLSTFLFSQTNSIVMAFAPNSFLLLVAMPFVFGSSRLTLFERFSMCSAVVPSQRSWTSEVGVSLSP